jgi:hypothetical protein
MIGQSGLLSLSKGGAQAAQGLDCVHAVGARVGPQPHRPFVVEIEPIEGELGRQARRVGGDPETLAARCPAIAEIGLLVDMRFVPVNQQVAVTLRASQQVLDLFDKGLPLLRIGPAEQLLGLFPGLVETAQRGPDRLATTA